jgi:hypothetical protein
VQEDADCVGLSVLSGAHLTLFARVTELLRERGAEDIVVFGGGIIPEDDIPLLLEAGVAKVFTPGRDDDVDRRVGARARRRAGGAVRPLSTCSGRRPRALDPWLPSPTVPRNARRRDRTPCGSHGVPGEGALRQARRARAPR